MLDSVKTKSRRLLNTPTEPKEIKLDFSWMKEWFSVRRPKLSALIIGAMLTWFLSSLLHNYYPAQFRDWLIPGSYLPFLVLLGLLQLYLYSYVLLSTGRALCVSLGVSWLVWLKLHRFEIDAPTILVTTGAVVIVCLLLRPKTTRPE